MKTTPQIGQCWVKVGRLLGHGSGSSGWRPAAADPSWPPVHMPLLQGFQLLLQRCNGGVQVQDLIRLGLCESSQLSPAGGYRGRARMTNAGGSQVRAWTSYGRRSDLCNNWSARQGCCYGVRQGSSPANGTGWVAY